jgi:hypothetical protein
MSMATVWLLLSLHGDMGPTFAITPINTFSTKAQCEEAIDHELKIHVGLSHSKGEFDHYRCTEWQGYGK